MGWDENDGLTEKDNKDISKDVDKHHGKAHRRENGPASYNGKPPGPEAADLFPRRASNCPAPPENNQQKEYTKNIKNTLQDIKIVNYYKRKYNTSDPSAKLLTA